MEETVGIEGVKAEDENAGAACTSESARAARDLERGLDCEVKIVVANGGDIIDAWSVTACGKKRRHNTDRAAFDDAGDGGTVFSRDRESSGERVRAEIKTSCQKVGALTVGGKWELRFTPRIVDKGAWY